MGTIADKLLYLNDAKVAMSTAIAAKHGNITIDSPLSDYASNIANIGGNNIDVLTEIPDWVRPTEWLNLPTPANNEFYVLFTFNNDIQYKSIAFLAQNAFTVDWGDGTITDHAFSTVAYHTYDFATHTSALTAEGEKQAIIKITPQAGLDLIYLSFAYNIEGYAYTSLGIREIKGQASLLGTFAVGEHKRLESIELIGTNVVTSFINCFKLCVTLQNVPLFYTGHATNMSGMFSGCYLIKSIPLFDTSNVTSMASMFANCFNLRYLPLFNTANVTTFAGMFTTNYVLKTVPHWNTSSATDMSNMFSNCFMLETVPLFNTALVTNIYNMFTVCPRLKVVPLFNTISVTSMTGMFNGCLSLERIPLFNTMNVTNMANMFQGCSNLTEIPLLNTTNVTTFSNTFNGCINLQTIPAIDTSSCTVFTQMFYGCKLLEELPAMNLSNATIINGMFSTCVTLKALPVFITSLNLTMMDSAFNSCYQLREIPFFNTSNVTDIYASIYSMYNMRKVAALDLASTNEAMLHFSIMPNLEQFSCINIKDSCTFDNCYSLSRNAILEIFGNLLTVTGKTISIKGCRAIPDLTAADLAIATNKGWTVITV